MITNGIINLLSDMTNSDPDSDSGHQNVCRYDESGFFTAASTASDTNGILPDAYGGARPKTRTTGGGGSSGTTGSGGGSGTASSQSRSARQHHRCRDWTDEERNPPATPNSNRRRRKVHRTNSSDSVFMIPGKIAFLRVPNLTLGFLHFLPTFHPPPLSPLK